MNLNNNPLKTANIITTGDANKIAKDSKNKITFTKQAIEWLSNQELFAFGPKNGIINSINSSSLSLCDLAPKFGNNKNNQSCPSLSENISTISCSSLDLSFDDIDKSPCSSIYDSINSPLAIDSIDTTNHYRFNKFITTTDGLANFLSRVVFADENTSKLMWKVLEESLLPNFLSIITSDKQKFNFEILLTKTGRFDSRFFSMDKMQLFSQITSGLFKDRKLASRILLDKILLCNSDDNIGSTVIQKLGMKRPKYITIMDTIIRILGNRALDLVQQDNGCFLIQHLYKHCSDKMKEFLSYYLEPRFKKLAKDRRGNYMCTMFITFTQDIKEDVYDEDVKRMNLKKRQIWKNLVRNVMEDAKEFYRLSCSEFGSFVMKKLVKHLEYDEQKSILFQLDVLGLISDMSRSQFGKFVLQNLLNSFRHHTHSTVSSWEKY